MADSSRPLPSSTPKAPQPRKLRDSCSSCASSKVKCSKEKPICTRCSRRGLACEYTASRRTGRTSLKVNHASSSTSIASTTSTSSTSVGTTATTLTSLSASTTAIDSGTPQESLAFQSLTPPSSTPAASCLSTSSEHGIPPPGPDIWHSLLSPGNTSITAETASALSPLIPIGNNFDDLFASVFPSPLLEHPEQPRLQRANSKSLDFVGLSVSEQDEHQLIAHQSILPNDDVSGSDLSLLSEPVRRSCLTTALEMLTQLFPNATTGCMLPGSQLTSVRKVPTIDSVISENKQIIEAISNMLECPCSHDEYLLTILSLVVFKVMAWYAAAAGDRSLADNAINWSNPFATLGHSDRQSLSSFQEQVLHLPTTIGNYCVDGDDRSRMAAQLVLSELHRVQRLVNLMSKRFEAIRLRNGSCSGSSSGSSSVADFSDIGQPVEIRGPPLSAPTFSQLEADLRKRLRAVSSEIIDTLRRE